MIKETRKAQSIKGKKKKKKGVATSCFIKVYA